MKKLIYSQEDLDLILSLETQEKDEKIDRLNNIINDFEEELEREINISEEDAGLEHNTYIDIKSTLEKVLKNFKELKEGDKE